MNTKPYYPHRERKWTIKAVFLIIGTLMVATVLFSCNPRHGCYGTRGMSGYGYLHDKSNGWVRCIETRTTAYFDKKGRLIHLCKK